MVRRRLHCWVVLGAKRTNVRIDKVHHSRTQHHCARHFGLLGSVGATYTIFRWVPRSETGNLLLTLAFILLAFDVWEEFDLLGHLDTT